MTRLRIFLGSSLLFLFVPLLVRSIIDTTTPAGWFVGSAFGLGTAIALLYPRRWAD